MANLFDLTIVTPDGKKLNDSCYIVNVMTTSGVVGIMKGHLPLIGVIKISHLSYRNDDGSFDIAISGGILNVKEDGVSILAESFERKEDIDIERANKAKERALNHLESKDPNIDIKRAQLALERALNRLSF